MHGVTSHKTAMFKKEINKNTTSKNYMAPVVHETSMDVSDRGKTKYALGKNLTQCQFVHHKCNLDWPASNQVFYSNRPATNDPRYEIRCYHEVLAKITVLCSFDSQVSTFRTTLLAPSVETESVILS